MADKLTLDQIRKQAKERISNKRKDKIRAVICYTSCSIIAGANEVLKSMQETLKSEEFENVIIETTGCMGICSKEPLVDIYMPDGRKFSYELVTAKKARAIIVSHVILDEPMKEWLLKI